MLCQGVLVVLRKGHLEGSTVLSLYVRIFKNYPVFKWGRCHYWTGGLGPTGELRGEHFLIWASSSN